MPTYEFICNPCNKRLEVFRRMSEAHLPEKCPSCSRGVQRIYSANTESEFKPYYSGDCGAYISSREGEKRELKKKGLMLYADTPGYDKWKSKIREHKRQPKHFMMGAK